MKLDTQVNLYIRKCLLLVRNITKQTIKENKRIKVNENIKKMSANIDYNSRISSVSEREER